MPLIGILATVKNNYLYRLIIFYTALRQILKPYYFSSTILPRCIRYIGIFVFFKTPHNTKLISDK